MASNQDHDDIADLLNNIFNLELGWLNLDKDTVRYEDIVEMRNLSIRLTSKMESRLIQQAIWTLSCNRNTINDVIIEPGIMHSFGFSENEKQEIIAAINKPLSAYFIERRNSSRRDLTYEEAIRVLADFYPLERRILHDAGLNQGAVSIIMQRIKQSENWIGRNISRSKVVLTGKYVRALEIVINNMKFVEEKASGKGIKVLRMSKKLINTKDKIIGLATLWGNAVPLIVSKDWGVASVISATAGATIAAIVPSGQRERPDDPEPR